MLLISVSFGFPVPEAAALLIPVIRARVQPKTVPPVLLIGVYENSVLLQIPGGVRVLVSAGIGFTITTTLYVAEVHPLEDKV